MTKAPRVLQFGTIGQLGMELIRRAANRGVELLPVTLEEADFTKPDQVARAVERSSAVDAVINAAAYTAVDKAESEEPLAMQINALSVGVLAKACAARGIPLIHISTDYVYDGRKAGFYDETDPVHPLGAYGRSKLAGEERVRQELPEHVILRTSWLYSAFGGNFVKTMLRLGAEREQLCVVNDQFGTPTAAGDLAEAVMHIAHRLCDGTSTVPYGTFHYSGAGETSWFGFAEAVFTLARDWAGLKASLAPIPTSEYKTVAVRPQNSRLGCDRLRRLYGIEPVPWKQALACVLNELRQQARTT